MPVDPMPAIPNSAPSAPIPLRRAFGLLFLLALLNVFFPYAANVPVFRDRQSYAQLPDDGKFFLRDVSYAFIFNPVRDFVRHHVATHHEIPLWASNALFGLPLVEQADFQLFNPLEWVNWLGGRSWWVLVLCLYLAWAGLGIFLVSRRLLCTAPWFALAAAAVYIISGTGMYALNYFAGLMNLLCLPFIIYHGTSLLIRRQNARWHFAGVVAYSGLLMTSGQPQYLALAALSLSIYFTVVAGLFWRRRQRLPFLVFAPFCGLLLAAPQWMPFLERQLAPAVYGGNHALVIGGSYWRSGLITSMRIFAPHMAGPIGATWHQPTGPDTTPRIESYQIGFGLVTVLLIGCGFLQAARRLRADRAPQAQLQAVFGFLGVALLAYVTVENLLDPPYSIWPFPFIHLNKYAPPSLALFLVLGIPAGFTFLAGRPFRFLLFAFLPVLAVPALIAGYLAVHSPVLHPALLGYVLIVTLAGALTALAAASFLRHDSSAGRAALVLPMAAIIDACLIHLQGLPATYDYWRIAVYLLCFVSILAAAGDRSRTIRLWPLACGAIAYFVLIGCLHSRIRFGLADGMLYREVKALATREAGRSGEARVLPAFKLIDTPTNLRYGVKSLLNIFPIYPLATQGYYVRHFAPEILASQQRLHSFMNFYGLVDSRKGDRSSLSWQTYADQKLFFDLLGVDLLIDGEKGELAALVAQGSVQGLKSVDAPELSKRGLRVYRSEASLGRAYFRQSYEDFPFVEDGAQAQALMRERGAKLRQTPLVETPYAVASRWDSLALPVEPHDRLPSNEVAATIIAKNDFDGHIVMHITAPAAGLFVLNEQYHPGWKAYLDKAEQPVLRVNTIAQGVIIPQAGDFQLEFRFVGSLRRDGLLALAGLLATGLGLLALPRPLPVGRCIRPEHHFA